VPRRVLFICHLNRCRSATAERLFSKREDLDVRSAGTSPDALVGVTEVMLDWADVVFTMDETQERAMRRMFPAHPALDGLICLEIPDDFTFNQPELVEMLRERVAPHLSGH
jgi:predicted protein tyrosine phosphatase